MANIIEQSGMQILKGLKVEITKPNGKWLVNGKPYALASYRERVFLDAFFLEVKLSKETTHHAN